MKFATFATLSLLSSTAFAKYYSNSTVTVDITTTDFVTTCPYPTTFTISTCSNDVCQPTTVFVTEATTITITGEVICPTVEESSVVPSNSYEESGSVVTTQITVTDFTTYCPYETTLTITKCENDKCHPTTIPVETATTITITGEVICPTTSTISASEEQSSEVEVTSGVVTTEITVTDYTTYCPYPTTLTVSTCENEVCHPTTIEVTTPSTVTVTGTVVCPTTTVETTTKPAVSTTTHEVITQSSVVTTQITTTDFTTYCPSPTTIVVSTCNEDQCHPTTVEITTPSTVVIPGTVVHPSTSVVVQTTTSTPQTPVVSTASSVFTTDITLTGYTTYCPESTTLILTTCQNDECAPHTISATPGETISVTNPVVQPSTHTTEVPVTIQPSTVQPTTLIQSASQTTVAEQSITPTPVISIAGGNKHQATIFGIFAIILASLF
ncbi:PGA13 GPI-anchored protein 13 [Candida maltosa Xu316]|uniref:Flocculation protein, putative (Gpi-anchored protein, putative) n=1 Tax=Candida maltosa (strain Xu316) TaxID=1245528 RepID=M3J7S5_CANMX|nr:Flocculation protein, putative (Gpi-anchored protein, putative) [Candida maltosa Xu316]